MSSKHKFVDWDFAVISPRYRNRVFYRDAGTLVLYREIASAENSMSEAEKASLEKVKQGKINSLFSDLKSEFSIWKKEVGASKEKAFKKIKQKVTEIKELSTDPVVRAKIKSFFEKIQNLSFKTLKAYYTVMTLTSSCIKLVTSFRDIKDSLSKIERSKLAPFMLAAFDWLRATRIGKSKRFSKVAGLLESLLVVTGDQELQDKLADFLSLSSSILRNIPITSKKQEQDLKEAENLAKTIQNSSQTTTLNVVGTREQQQIVALEQAKKEGEEVEREIKKQSDNLDKRAYMVAEHFGKRLENMTIESRNLIDLILRKDVEWIKDSGDEYFRILNVFKNDDYIRKSDFVIQYEMLSDLAEDFKDLCEKYF